MAALQRTKTLRLQFLPGSVPFFMLLPCLIGCAVWKASQQPDAKNVGVLHAGVTRAEVVAEIGAPVSSEVRDGNRHDLFTFTQGYSKATKTGRVFAHAAADVMTLGLWEVVGMPLETAFDGRTVKVEVVYDARDVVEEVHVIEGADIIRSKSHVARQPTTAPSGGKGMRAF